MKVTRNSLPDTMNCPSHAQPSILSAGCREALLALSVTGGAASTSDAANRKSPRLGENQVCLLLFLSIQNLNDP